MKKIIAAWIEQILEFDSKLEYMTYIEELKQKDQKFQQVSYDQLKAGVVQIQIRKQYNKNQFPMKEGAIDEV